MNPIKQNSDKLLSLRQDMKGFKRKMSSFFAALQNDKLKQNLKK